MNGARLIPLSGVAAVVLISAGFIAAGSTPSDDAPMSEIVAFYTAHDGAQVASGVLLGLGALFFLLFCAALMNALWESGAARLWLVPCFGGGLLFVVGITIAAGLAVFIGNLADALDPAALQALHEANLLVVFPWTVGASAFLLGASAAVLRSDPLPPWLGWMALVLGVVAAIPSHVLGGALYHIGVVSIAGLGIWTVIVSVLLARRRETLVA
jgi:hypothetical protein